MNHKNKMKQTIEGKAYDTEKATLVAEASNYGETILPAIPTIHQP
jgi:hypothetical protein